jgi:hypothetical protein
MTRSKLLSFHSFLSLEWKEISYVKIRKAVAINTQLNGAALTKKLLTLQHLQRQQM